MDYRELLIKYMAFIISQEGLDYIDYINDGWNDKLPITDEEKEELERLSEETSKYPK